MAVLAKVTSEAGKITGLVLLMMVAVEALNVVSRGGLKILAQGGRWQQYVGAAFLGALPGCLGSFAAVSLYIHGMLSFGALVGNMIATSGDEAFVMLAMAPRSALGLFALLFVLGIGSAWLTDRFLPILRFHPCSDCRRDTLHPGEGGLRHFLREHVWRHLLREHLWRVFLWTLGTLAVVEIGLKQGPLESFVTQHGGWVLLLAAVVGIIPESGPHLIFVTLFVKGLVPFSVLFVSSFVQDGHGLLPLLSYSWKDALMLKAINLALGLSLGALLYGMGR